MFFLPLYCGSPSPLSPCLLFGARIALSSGFGKVGLPLIENKSLGKSPGHTERCELRIEGDVLVVGGGVLLMAVDDNADSFPPNFDDDEIVSGSDPES